MALAARAVPVGDQAHRLRLAGARQSGAGRGAGGADGTRLTAVYSDDRGAAAGGDRRLFAGLLLFAALVRWQTLGNPLIGFDEQFYLLVGDRMWHDGALPFVDIFDRKPIGLFLIYAAVRALGGQGFIQYQLAALVFVAATALLVARFTTRIAAWPAAPAAACLYILWLNFMECEGGQAPVFYNGVMVAAALSTWRAIADDGHRLRAGLCAMLLVGIALQIKYTVVVEGACFGLAMLWAAARDRWPRRRLALAAASWAGAALLPTLAALGWYGAIGHGEAFVFANFRSIAGRLPDPVAARALGLALIAAILLPLAAQACAGRRIVAGGTAAARSFVLLWLAAAAAGLLLLGNPLNPQSGAPLLAPLAIAGSPVFSRPGRSRRVWLGVAAAALVLGQIVLAVAIRAKGGSAEAHALARAAWPRPGRCLYVYDGPPALYVLTRSCLPTRWPFPGHLNTQDEASVRAIGTDPLAEVRRILATRPDAIVDEWPAYALGNPATHRLVLAAAARHYRLVLRLPRGGGGYRLVYRLVYPLAPAINPPAAAPTAAAPPPRPNRSGAAPPPGSARR